MSCDNYPILGRPPKTLHEHFLTDPRGADSFGKWIEDRMVDLMRQPARGQSFRNGGWRSSPANPVWELGTWLEVAIAASKRNTHAKIRVILLDDTIIKEWPQR